MRVGASLDGTEVAWVVGAEPTVVALHGVRVGAVILKVVPVVVVTVDGPATVVALVDKAAAAPMIVALATAPGVPERRLASMIPVVVAPMAVPTAFAFVVFVGLLLIVSIMLGLGRFRRLGVSAVSGSYSFRFQLGCRLRVK